MSDETDEEQAPAQTIDGGSPGASDAEAETTPVTTREAWSDEEDEEAAEAADPNSQSSTTQAAWSDEDEVVVPDEGDDNGEGEPGIDGGDRVGESDDVKAARDGAEDGDASASKSRKEKRASKPPLDPAAAAQAEAALQNLSKAIVKHLKKVAGGVGEKVPLKDARTALGVQASKSDFKTAAKSAAKLPGSGFVVDGKDLRLPTAAERADAVKAEAAAKVAAVRASAVQSAVDKNKLEAERKKGTTEDAAPPPPDSSAKSSRGSKGGVRFEEPSEAAESEPPSTPLSEGLSLDDDNKDAGVSMDDTAAASGEASGPQGEEAKEEGGSEDDADVHRDENEALYGSGGANNEASATAGEEAAQEAEGSDSMTLEEMQEALEEGILTQDEFDTLAAALAAEASGGSSSSSSGVGWGSFGSAVDVSAVGGLGSDLGASVFDAWGTISSHASQAAATATSAATGGRSGANSDGKSSSSGEGTRAADASAAAASSSNERPTGGAGTDAWIEGSSELEAGAAINEGEVKEVEEGWEGVSTVSAAADLAQQVEREAALEAEALAEANAMLEAAKKPKDEDALHSLVIDGLATLEELREVRKAYRAASEKMGNKDLDKVGFKNLVKGLAKLRYEGLDVSGMKDKDLDVAFIIADEDKSGGVDLDEFLNLYKLIKKGEVVGLGALSADARTKKRQFKAALASARDAERHIAMALAAAADEKAKGEEEVGNRHKSEPQIAAERELAIKVGRLMTMTENELKRGLLEEGFKFRVIQNKSGDECRLLLSTKWTQAVREMSLSPEERAQLEEKRAAERAAEAEKLKPAEILTNSPDEATSNPIHGVEAGGAAGLGTEVPPPPLQSETTKKVEPPAAEANSFLSILSCFG